MMLQQHQQEVISAYPNTKSNLLPTFYDRRPKYSFCWCRLKPAAAAQSHFQESALVAAVTREAANELKRALCKLLSHICAVLAGMLGE